MLINDKCVDCRPVYAHLLRRNLNAVHSSTLVLSSAPFFLTWLAVVIIAQQRLFPLLRSDARQKDELPHYKRGASQAATGGRRWRWFKRLSAQRLASLVFSTSIGLSAVLVELLLCEISDTLSPAARGLALRLTLVSLLVLNVVITPALEIHGIAKTVIGSPSEATSTRTTRPRARMAFEFILLGSWLAVFWYIPRTSILRSSLQKSQAAVGGAEAASPFVQACLERIGIIGISLMASLAGFAAVSSLWQTFGVQHRAVADADLSRKEAGLAASEEMLAAKRSRLRALQRRMSESVQPSGKAGFVGRVVGSLRSNPDAQESKTLEMEISGLETMCMSLSSSLSSLRARHADQKRSLTRAGKIFGVFNTIFSVYCAYRICATSISSLRRWWQPNHSFATSDPINNILALLTTHWDSNLDRVAWSRQISFLLSGVMLLASFNAVLQTFLLFTRFAPRFLHHAHTSLPLVISQIAGTYVISSALLLRSNLPAEVSSVISEALGSPLESRFVEAWFESWFLVAVGMTATGIFIGRKVGGVDDGWDDDGLGSEGGNKRS